MNHEEAFGWADAPYWIKYIPEHERADIPAEQFAGPGRTFPIRNETDLENAAYLVGHAKDPNAVREKAMAIAKRDGLRLPEAWQYHADRAKAGKSLDTLVFMGGEVKVIDARKVGGYGVLFTTPKDPDTYEEFFDRNDTDFDIADDERRSMYFNHGFDPEVGNRKIGTFTTKKTDIGLWVEGVLKEGDEYADAILQMVQDKKLGYSSGAVSHLVRRERVGKTSNVCKITSWPLGEMSLTNKPAEPRAWAIPLKSWFNPQTEETPAVPETKAAVSIATVRQFEEYLRDAGYSNKQATAIASHGFKGLLRDADEPENQSDTFRADALRELARTELQLCRQAGVAL